MILIPAVILAIESEDDRAFMSEVYTKHSRLMLKIARSIAGVDAEDVLSDSCVALIQVLEKLRTMNDGEMRKYIVITVKNTALNHWRKKQRETAMFQTYNEEEDERTEAVPSSEHKILLQEELYLVREAMKTLTPREKDLLRMKYGERKSNAEIAATIGLSVNSISQYVNRARARLKAALYEGGAEG